MNCMKVSDCYFFDFTAKTLNFNSNIGAPISKQDSKQKVELIMNKFDFNNNGAISRTEFLECVSNDPQLKNRLLCSRQASNNSLQSQSSN